MDRTCSEEGCDTPWVAKGLCKKHYQRMKKHGTTAEPKRRERGTCSVNGCDREHYGKGYCRPHWVKFCKARCAVDGCDKPRSSNGWCAAHNWAAQRHGDPLAGKKHRKSGGPCSTPGCEGEAATVGLCARCYGRSRRNGSPKGKRAVRCSCLEIDSMTGLSTCGDGREFRPRETSVVPNRITMALDRCELVITRRNGAEVTCWFDPDDADWVTSVQWQLDPAGYVVTRCPYGRLPARMHRLVAGLSPDDPMDPDHIDGVRTNNLRSNLRVVTHARNGQNQAIKNGRGSSRYRGVCWVTSRQHWIAHTTVLGKFKYVGSYATEEAAAEAIAQYRSEHDLLPGY